MSLTEDVYEWIKRESLTEPGSCVLIGLSGGADSVCLALVLKELQARMNLKLLAVHVHHGIRGADADADAAFAGEFGRTHDIPVIIRRCDAPGYAKEHGMSLEEAARELRYGILEEEAEKAGADAIAVAHHQDDNAETILLNLFRGSGLKGLAGIPLRRGRIIRPLLCVGRRDIEVYLQENGESYCTDRTNEDVNFARNRIRCQILPKACEANAQAKEHIVKAGRIIGEADAYLRSQAEAVWDTAASEKYGEVNLLLSAFCRLEPILQKYVVMLALEKLSSARRDIGAVHMEAVLALADKQVGREIHLPCKIKASREYGCIRISRGLKSESAGEWEFIQDIFPYDPSEKIPENRYTKWFDYDKIVGTVSVRNRRAGDYIGILPKGSKKTVKAFMTDEKIPRRIRDEILLVADGSHILWIVGYRISEDCKVSEHTKTILQIQAIKKQ